MTTAGNRPLAGLLAAAARRAPGRTALVEPGTESVTYRELLALSLGISERLHSMGVQPGDRVALLQRKSIAAVASILGTLQAGAAYVPLDAAAPPARNAGIIRDCSVKALIAQEFLVQPLLKEMDSPAPEFHSRVAPVPGQETVFFSRESNAARRDESESGPQTSPPAYILYTSGSTGSPKGVVHSHAGAMSFIDWCARRIGYVSGDRFASHAPFHFDLSVHDLFVALRHQARLVLVAEETAKNPPLLARLIADEGVSVWYSAPSALSLLARFGKLDALAFPRLRLVLFAGEVFPMAPLRLLRGLWAAPRYYNLFGPTETNVCTYYPLPGSEETAGMDALPIGRTCEHLLTRVAGQAGEELGDGLEGELIVSGPAVMDGYFGQARMTREAFFMDAAGCRWYRTGDRVARRRDGNHLFLGRRDRMVKRHGYRIELQEIEACLNAHPQAREAAAVAVPSGDGTRIDAHVVLADGAEASVLAFKEYCARRLPRSMVPDRFAFPELLPRTSNAKVDYRKLAEEA